jgi:hypothetical protein
MARAPNNFHYQGGLPASIGGDLARALFGDPQAAQQQAESRAQMDAQAAQAERARAAAGYDAERTVGQRTANNAQGSLPDLIGSFLQSQQPQEHIPIDSAAFADFDTPLPEPAPQPDPMASLAALVGAMGQQQGDKIDPRHIMGTVGAFGGDDELARRGMVAQGKTPGEEFAITPDRADEIAEAGYAADLLKALGVAEVNNRDDIPVAEIAAGSRRDVADINAGAKRDVAGIGAAASGPAKRPPRVTAAETKTLRGQMNELLPGFAPTDAKGDEAEPTIGTPATRAFLLSRAIEIYQRTGNVAGAVQQALQDNKTEADARRSRLAPQPGAVGDDKLRADALSAIAAGAPRAAVAARYKKLTGKPL